jgi:hypothetical protein
MRLDIAYPKAQRDIGLRLSGCVMQPRRPDRKTVFGITPVGGFRHVFSMPHEK